MSTSEPVADHRLLRFGLFQVDLRAGELRKDGNRIRLQEQPFQVLAALLSQPGEIVTRDELRERLWSADTFVDFDHSLNTAMNKIREALGDSASNPRFIETLAKRGYRFIAPVQVNRDAPNPAAVNPRPEVAQFSGNSDLREEMVMHQELEVPLPRRTITRRLFGLIQVMYLVFYLVALFHWVGIDRVADSFAPGWLATTMVMTVWLTALVGIPLRLYLISSVAFDHRRFGDNFQRLFVLILPLDLLWATAPLLLIPQIGIGLAFAATAALLYSPFSERTLVRLAY